MDALRIKCNKVERKAGRKRGDREERQQACLDRPSGQKVGGGGGSVWTHTQFPDSQLEGEETNCLFVQQLPNKVERV